MLLKISETSQFEKCVIYIYIKWRDLKSVWLLHVSTLRWRFVIFGEIILSAVNFYLHISEVLYRFLFYRIFLMLVYRKLL